MRDVAPRTGGTAKCGIYPATVVHKDIDPY